MATEQSLAVRREKARAVREFRRDRFEASERPEDVEVELYIGRFLYSTLVSRASHRNSAMRGRKAGT